MLDPWDRAKNMVIVKVSESMFLELMVSIHINGWGYKDIELVEWNYRWIVEWEGHTYHWRNS